jgi:Domain of unknown function (DUF4381)
MAINPTTPPPLPAAAARELAHLADIVTPPPVSWMPHTLGWAVLAAAALVLAIWVAARAYRRWRRARYRREALREIELHELALGDAGQRAAALAALAVILKRVAMAAGPRADAACLSRARWIDFLNAHGGGTELSVRAVSILDDLEYRGAGALGAVKDDEAREFSRTVRDWVEHHRVPA